MKLPEELRVLIAELQDEAADVDAPDACLIIDVDDASYEMNGPVCSLILNEAAYRARFVKAVPDAENAGVTVSRVTVDDDVLADLEANFASVDYTP